MNTSVSKIPFTESVYGEFPVFAFAFTYCREVIEDLMWIIPI